MIDIKVIESPEAFEKLSEAWQALSQRVTKSRFSQSYDWCHAGWTHRGEGDKARLKCLTVWQGHELVGVWAFKRVRKGVVAHLEPLGTGLGGECADPLLDDAVDRPEVYDRLLREIKKHGDVVNLHSMMSGGVLEAARRLKRPCLNYVIESFVIDPTKAANWEAFMGSYSKNMRMQLRRSMNRLLAMGKVELVLAEDEAQAREISDWLLEQKRNWLKARHTHNNWFAEAHAAAFLRETALAKNAAGRGALFALKLNGTIIAASVNTVDQARVDGMILTFDPAYAHYSPGMLILQETTLWAYERGLVHDLGTLRMDYKLRWASYTDTHETFIFGLTTIGALRLSLKWGVDRVQDQIRARLSGEAVKTLKGIVTGQWRKPAQAAEPAKPESEPMAEAA